MWKYILFWIAIHTIGRLPSSFVDPNLALPQAFANSVKAVHGGRPKFGVNRGFTDMHYFVHESGLPTVGYGPAGKGAHAIDESTGVKDLTAAAQVYAHFLSAWEGA